MTMLRALPPKGGGAETPGNVANSGRTRFKAASCNWPTVRVSLEKTKFPTGTLPASKRMMNGGTVPGGMNARARLTYATVSDMAWDTSGMELQFDDRRALNGLGLDVLDAGDIQEMVFVIISEITFHLGGVHAAIRLRDVNRRNAESRENIARH